MDYIKVISEKHTGVEVSASDATDYNTITWGGTAIAQATLDAEWLEMYKIAHITTLAEEAEARIQSGYESDAVTAGTMLGYASAAEDQFNLIGSVAAGDDMYYSTWADGIKTYVLHTHAQLVQVVKDGRDIKLGELQALNTKTATIMAALTEAEVDAVV